MVRINPFWLDPGAAEGETQGTHAGTNILHHYTLTISGTTSKQKDDYVQVAVVTAV